MNPATPDLDAWIAALRTSALVGTGRRPPAAPPALLGHPVEDGEPLLDQAALFDVIVRAGTVPRSAQPVEPCPPEARPVAPAAATRLLALLLTQPPLPGELRDELLINWLHACAASGAVVAPDMLGPIFQVALRNLEIRSALVACWGERGRWLAALRQPRLARLAAVSTDPVRDDAHVEALVTRWPTLDLQAADAELRRLRSTHPDKARELLESHWTKLPAKARAQHLGCLEVGLSLGDEAFLESALDDRALTVRAAAADLLTHLPGSQLRERMGERLAPLLTVRRRLLRRPEITVSMPPPPDAAAIRDGLQAADPKLTGQQAGWLRAIIAAAPLETWTRATQLSIDEIAANIDDQNGDLVSLSQAVARAGDRRWADALAGRSVNADVVASMSAEKREGWLCRHIPMPSVAPRTIATALDGVPQPWSPAVSKAIVERIADSEDHSPMLTVLGTDLYTGLHPEAIDMVRTLRERPVADPDKHARARTTLRTILQFHTFNHTIRDAFAQLAEEAS